MREIKFKVWNDDSKRMNFISLTNENCGCGWIQSPKTHFMQFTGLHDRTGKEIYTGDILKYSFQKKQTLSHSVIESINPGWEIWEIKYIAPSFVYTIHSQDNSYFGELPSKPRVISLHYLNAVEVVGNIYEHSHLLQSVPSADSPKSEASK